MSDTKVIVEVSGGVVQAVWGTENYEVLDWDNLLGDCYTRGDCANAWSDLSAEVQETIKTEYPSDYARILARIAQDEAITPHQPGGIPSR